MPDSEPSGPGGAGQAAAAAAGQPAATPPPSGFEATVTDAAKKILVTLLTAVGSLSFVVLTGGAILWVRFASADLPADQAVVAVPRTELLVIGAAALVGFVLAGLLVVASS